MADLVESLAFILLVAATVVVLPLIWLVRRRRARQQQEREFSELLERPYTGPSAFSFRFESTHRDLLDAYAAHQLSASGLSPLERALVIGLGIFWVGCAIVFGPRAVREGRWWQPLIPLCLGTSIIWKRLVTPLLARRRIHQTNPSVQPLALHLTDSGIRIEAKGVGVLDRAWNELGGVEVADKGIAIGFTDGITNWLPNRVFPGEDERRMCAAYLMSKLPEESEEL